MTSPYHAALLLRLRHIVGVRRDPKRWADTNAAGRILVKRSLWAALGDAEQEGLSAEMAEIITPSEAWKV